MASEAVDKDGLTEAEFLAAYKQKDYPKPSLTADIAVFRSPDPAALLAERREWAASGASGGPIRVPQGLELLLVRRGGHPYLGSWALPGGFVEEGEDDARAAARELFEETGLADVPLEPFGLYSTPGRDPRCWTVSAAHLAIVGADEAAHAGDDAADARWFRLMMNVRQNGTHILVLAGGGETLTSEFSLVPQRFATSRAQVTGGEGLAFDHARIVADALLRLLGR